MSFLLIEIGLAYVKCYRWVKESKENVEDFKDMLHHVCFCIRVKRIPPSKVNKFPPCNDTYKRSNLNYKCQVGLQSSSRPKRRDNPLYIEAVHSITTSSILFEISEVRRQVKGNEGRRKGSPSATKKKGTLPSSIWLFLGQAAVTRVKERASFCSHYNTTITVT